MRGSPGAQNLLSGYAVFFTALFRIDLIASATMPCRTLKLYEREISSFLLEEGTIAIPLVHRSMVW